jgi:hypothetical protein
MTTESAVQDLTDNITNLIDDVNTQQTQVTNAVNAIAATTNTVNTELNLVDNTADVDKPVSTAQQTAINLKQNTLVSGVNISEINGVSILSGSPLAIERGRQEMPMKDYANRADLRTPVTPVPDTDDIVSIPRLGVFQYISVITTGSTQYIDDDEMVFEAIDPFDGANPGAVIGQWVMSVPSYEFTEAQKMFENAVMQEWMEDEQLRHNTY